MCASEVDLFKLFDKLGIKTETIRHPAVHRVEDNQALRGSLKGGHCKCLFVKDKKGNKALAIMDENRKIDLKAFAEKMEMKRLSFGSPDGLFDTLGVKPGSVTPFALMNRLVDEAEEADLKVVLDASMLKKTPLNYHPLHNEATVQIDPDDLLMFIHHCGYKPIIHDFDSVPSE
jgi:Ala-tRNA(Pro) deacylase